jgi:hypothetical protein
MSDALGRILGTTDEITTCDHCGRADLKSTVVIESAEGLNHYGSTCYAKFVGVAAKDVRTAAKKADAAREELERAAREAARGAELKEWIEWCRLSHGCGMLSCSSLISWIACLGGMQAARAKYQEWKVRRTEAEKKRAASLSQAI